MNTKKDIITIAGRPGSGKSTASKSIASALGYDHFSSGDLFRSIISERGIELTHANLIAEEIADIDHAVDAKLKEIGETESRRVIDSRMAWFWIPESFKVFLDLDLTIAATRVLASIDASRTDNEDVPSDPLEYAESLKKRLDGEAKKYQRLYSANPYDVTNYDLVVDTSLHDSEQTREIILREFINWQSRNQA
jgi:cytidylate kinase